MPQNLIFKYMFCSWRALFAAEDLSLGSDPDTHMAAHYPYLQLQGI